MKTAQEARDWADLTLHSIDVKKSEFLFDYISKAIDKAAERGQYLITVGNGVAEDHIDFPSLISVEQLTVQLHKFGYKTNMCSSKDAELVYLTISWEAV